MRIKSMEMPCNSLCIPKFGQKVLAFCQIYFSSEIGVPEFDRNVFIVRKVNIT